MTVKQFIENNPFEVINEGSFLDREITKPFCCDLLSIAMSKACAGCVWVTIMANINTLAVAELAEVAVIVLAEGVKFDEASFKRAEEKGITILATTRPIYEAARMVDDLINA